MYSNFYKIVKAQGIEAAADYAARLGFSSVEFLDAVRSNWVDTVPSVEAAREYRRVLGEKNLSVACYTVAVGLYDPTSPDGVNHAAEEGLMRCAERAVALGAPYLHHTITIDIDDTPIPYDRMLATVLPSVVRVAKYAASLGIACLYEEQGTYFNGVEGFGRFYRAVKAEVPNVGICGDIGNTLFINENSLSFFRTFATEFKHVHLKDYVVCAAGDTGADMVFDGTYVKEYMLPSGTYLKECVIGDGIIETVACLEILKNTNYAGAIALENNHESDYAAGVRTAIALVNKIMRR